MLVLQQTAHETTKLNKEDDLHLTAFVCLCWNELQAFNLEPPLTAPSPSVPFFLIDAWFDLSTIESPQGRT